ncbi:hypothetical protein E2C01_034853 [Portunus trituberculatus]|uniref:Uncharacterized protein n=1 Tax=Portunus trituberculatus TaxID=210409 RepID=A0A5B7F6M3_PORTR|nr:hypothetical protein [Portunus trituberculatus]
MRACPFIQSARCSVTLYGAAPSLHKHTEGAGTFHSWKINVSRQRGKNRPLDPMPLLARTPAAFSLPSGRRRKSCALRLVVRSQGVVLTPSPPQERPGCPRKRRCAGPVLLNGVRLTDTKQTGIRTISPWSLRESWVLEIWLACWLAAVRGRQAGRQAGGRVRYIIRVGEGTQLITPYVACLDVRQTAVYPAAASTALPW